MNNIEPMWTERYSRQILFPPFGTHGQELLGQSRALLVGCGGLGTAIANHLVRGGIGHLRIVDPDTVQGHNLHRQGLYDEDDVLGGQPKAQIALRKLQAANRGVDIEAVTARMDRDNAADLTEGVQLVLDGTDNFSARYLINDACIRAGIPWIYGGVVGSIGMTMNILPERGPCLRCLFPDPPAQSLTADTAGILNSLPAVVAAIQTAEAYKILLGAAEVRKALLYLDLWSSEFRLLEVKRADGCPCCGQHRFEFLEG